jgi:sulfatase maturation enzyme AslB (radical SAM superfamily)
MTKDILREQKLAELALAIRHHDHYHTMSDDYRVYSSGRSERDHIMSELDTMFDKVSDKLEFWNSNCPDNVGYRQEYINELKSEGK